MSDSFAADPTRVAHVIVLSVFAFLALVAVIFRLWARRVQRSRWALNDYLCVVGLVFALALAVFTIYSQVYWDLGGDLTQKGNPQAVLDLVILQVKAMLVGEILWVTAVFFVRASVLQLYIHLFYSTKPFRLTCYVVHAVNFGYAAGTVMAACLVCRPIAYAWNPTIPGGSCGDQKSLDIFIGVFNLLMDVTVVILPMPVLWGLQMGVQKKIVLSAIFGMGIVICIITLVRIWITSLIQGDSNAQKIYSIIALLTGLEASLGVINACLPVMKPVFTKFGDSKIYSFFSNSFPSATSSSSPSKSSKLASAPGQSNTKGEVLPSSSVPRKSTWNFSTSKNAASTAAARIFSSKTNNGMQAWPSANAANSRKPSTATITTTTTTSPPSPESNMHRFVGDKAAQIMFSHTSTTSSTASGPTRKTSPSKSKSNPKTGAMATATMMDQEKQLPPRPPPKSKYYRPERKGGEAGPGVREKELGIVVRREWDVDVERGDVDSRGGDGVRGSGSDDVGRELLRDGGGGGSGGGGYERHW